MPLSLSGDGTLSGVDIAASGLGRVLQVVRATDSTRRSTTSSSFVDVAGMSVTITPQVATSAILLIGSWLVEKATTRTEVRLTDSSDNVVSGADRGYASTTEATTLTLFGYSTPATTSAVTYKTRFRAIGGGTAELYNDVTTGQMYAIEVAA
jgi:hypothetical protein